MSLLLLELLIYLGTAALFVYVAWLFFRNAEMIARGLWHQPPFSPSCEPLRDAVVQEIRSSYPNVKTACDIGSGYGGLARRIAKDCGLRVAALENMPFAATVSMIADWISGGISKTIWCDAFEYVEKSDGFDLAVAYMGPKVAGRLIALRNKIRVLITLDFPVEGLEATRTIIVPGGYTLYNGVKYPHKLFVYELQK
ncbi:MAG: hypothetical protein LBQ49_02620 [Rickettsiales bacterium]|nr:hypothetical protein [Rickettsiales bacterium]